MVKKKSWQTADINYKTVPGNNFIFHKSEKNNVGMCTNLHFSQHHSGNKDGKYGLIVVLILFV